jgi:hypothetical protein
MSHSNIVSHPSQKEIAHDKSLFYNMDKSNDLIMRGVENANSH